MQANTGISFDRLALGFQSHISDTAFTSKAALTQTFSTLAELGAEAMITELDVSLSGTTEENLRFQAAIWGDYLDVRPSLVCFTHRVLKRNIGMPLREQL